MKTIPPFAMLIPVLLAAYLLCLPGAAARPATSDPPDVAGRVKAQMPDPGRPVDADHEIEMDVHVGRAAAPAADSPGRIAYMPDEVPSGMQPPECSPSFLARVEGRRAARMPPAERAQYVQWCEAAARLDAPATARAGPSPAAAMVAPGGEPPKILCPPSSTQCYCWNGKHYNGCQNYTAHCKGRLSCGPGGKVCHCESN